MKSREASIKTSATFLDLSLGFGCHDCDPTWQSRAGGIGPSCRRDSQSQRGIWLILPAHEVSNENEFIQ